MHTTLHRDLEVYLKNRGATFIAAADLNLVPAEKRVNLPRGIVIGQALDPYIIAGLENGPTEAYWNEYKRANADLDVLGRLGSEFIEMRGFTAIAQRASAGWSRETLTTRLPHKTIATLAGVGWIGKCALLIHRKYGSAVRYTTFLTDAPIPVAESVTSSRCGNCEDCVTACPGQAPKGREWMPGLERQDFFDAFACRSAIHRICAERNVEGLVCGICIYVCRFTQKFLLNLGAITAMRS
jgi:epoxyqueuosine reductase QueG